MEKISCAPTPFNELSIDDKKKFAVSIYYSLMKDMPNSKKCDVYDLTAKIIDMSAVSVRKYVHEWELNHGFETSKQGKHAKIQSPIENDHFR